MTPAEERARIVRALRHKAAEFDRRKESDMAAGFEEAAEYVSCLEPLPVRAALATLLDAFCSMPDAGLRPDDPRWQWWHETASIRDAARASLDDEAATA